MNKLHLGCGKRYLEGYTHIDLADFPHIDYKSSIDDLSMLKNNSIDLIYASHCFEYFDQEEAKTVLHEWRRVLKKNGVLRLAVPDFEKLIKVYKISNNLKNILGPIFGKWNLNDTKNIYHKTIYDRRLLTNLLENNGFHNVVDWDWKKVFINHPDYDDHSQAYYPHMDKENGILISLNLECKKF